jgi:hypothetical protein
LNRGFVNVRQPSSLHWSVEVGAPPAPGVPVIIGVTVVVTDIPGVAVLVRVGVPIPLTGVCVGVVIVPVGVRVGVLIEAVGVAVGVVWANAAVANAIAAKKAKPCIVLFMNDSFSPTPPSGSEGSLGRSKNQQPGHSGPQRLDSRGPIQDGCQRPGGRV